MGIDTIGQQIAIMRKEKGIKQEELANYVGVSTQAVSKWENGGIPDTELLPKIADFFNISVDSLFGKNITDYSDLNSALIKKIIKEPQEQKFKTVLNFCWDMERALLGGSREEGSIEDYEKRIGKNEQWYSSIINDYGFTRMGVANRLQYFLLVPEIKDTETAFFNGIDYLSFFKSFSNKNVFDACVFLNKRESNSAFTVELLVKNLDIKCDDAARVLDILEKYGLLQKTQIEIDDGIRFVYKFTPTPSFVALLIFAREMIDIPNNFIYYGGGRCKPYLK